jgi:hypothetical protein
VADFGETPAGLPKWPEIKGHALGRLNAARDDLSEVANWLRTVDSPLTPAEARECGEARRLAIQAKNLIDEAKGVLQREGTDRGWQAAFPDHG